MDKTIEIQTPTPGRVVLYSPTQDSPTFTAVAGGVMESVRHRQGYLPATVIHHDGSGQVALAVAGVPGTYTARYGERSPGVPAPGCWCYPEMRREFTAVQACLSA